MKRALLPIAILWGGCRPEADKVLSPDETAGVIDTGSGPVDTAVPWDDVPIAPLTSCEPVATATLELLNDLNLIEIEAGTFLMGSAEDDTGAIDTWETYGDSSGHLFYSEFPQHEVVLTRGFLMGATEVTLEAYVALMGHVSKFRNACRHCPVTVNWWEAACFLNALSVLDSRDPCYTCGMSGADGFDEGYETMVCELDGDPYSCDGYRLPTEAEWEYAARSGGRDAFPSGGNLSAVQDAWDCGWPYILDNGEPLGAQSWYCGHSSRYGDTVGLLAPNAWGLYDMSGNAWEWTSDGVTPFSADSQTDPYVPPVSDGWALYGIIRGGNTHSPPIVARSAVRSADYLLALWGLTGTGPTGFRVTRTAP